MNEKFRLDYDGEIVKEVEVRHKPSKLLLSIRAISLAVALLSGKDALQSGQKVISSFDDMARVSDARARLETDSVAAEFDYWDNNLQIANNDDPLADMKSITEASDRFEAEIRHIQENYFADLRVLQSYFQERAIADSGNPQEINLALRISTHLDGLMRMIDENRNTQTGDNFDQLFHLVDQNTLHIQSWLSAEMVELTESFAQKVAALLAVLTGLSLLNLSATKIEKHRFKKRKNDQDFDDSNRERAKMPLWRRVTNILWPRTSNSPEMQIDQSRLEDGLDTENYDLPTSEPNKAKHQLTK